MGENNCGCVVGQSAFDNFARIHAGLTQRPAKKLMRLDQALGDGAGEVLTAALLHDCGKGQVRLWQRIAQVLSPGICSRYAVESGAEWRQALWRLRYHPRIGADLAARAGSTPEVVRLIGSQEDETADPWLKALQAADDA